MNALNTNCKVVGNFSEGQEIDLRWGGELSETLFPPEFLNICA